MYVLYHFPYSQHARRVVSLLIEADLPYELRPVDMSEGEHLREGFLRINPNHQVPVLLDGDFKLSESNAILRYLCNKHALTQWYPEEPEARAAVDQWLDWNQCRLSPVVVDLVLNSVFLGDKGDRAAIERAQRELPERFAVLEDSLSGERFVPLAKPTIADLSIASNIYQLGLAGFHPRSGPLRSWYERVASLRGFTGSIDSLNAD